MAEPADVPRLGADPDPAALAARFPLELPSDFIAHEPSLTSFRALAARHRLPPAAAQELMALHVAELRRLAEVEDPVEQVRRMYPNTPKMRP